MLERLRPATSPNSEGHPEGKLGQATDREPSLDPHPVAWINNQQEIADKKPDCRGEQKKGPWTQSPGRAEKEGEDKIELDEHGKVPPRGVEIIEVICDIDETQSEQTENEATI